MNRIFKWFSVTEDADEEEAKAATIRTYWFAAQFSCIEFEGINKLLFGFLEFCAKMAIPVKRQYLESFLRTDGKQFIKAQNLKLDTMLQLNYDEPGALEEAFRVLSDTALVMFDQYMKEPIEGKVFKIEMNEYLCRKKEEAFQKAVSDAFVKMSNGAVIDDIIEEQRDRLFMISKLYDKRCLDRLDFLLGRRMVSEDSKNMRFITTTGIPCIDGDSGGLYTKQVWNLTGSPGTGKTRFSAVHIAYQAAVKHKVDVLYDELELTQMEVENILIAFHITKLFGIKIPDSVMNKEGQMTETQRQYYNAAKIDLFESGKYGRITIRTEKLVVEDMESSMYSYLRHNPKTKVWVIDYWGICKSVPKSKYDRQLQKYEVITAALEAAKTIAKDADIGVFGLSQFNDKGIEAAKAGKKIVSGYVEGGHVVERTVDYDLAMTMTEDQERVHMAMLSTVKKRAAAGFQNQPLHMDLSVSMFEQISAAAATN